MSTQRIFILEDDPNRIIGFRSALQGADLTICTTLSGPDGAFARFTPPYNLILLDHDLGGAVYVESDGTEETGYKFAKWLAEHHSPLLMENPFCPIIIHSWNPDGARNMATALDAYQWFCQRREFSPQLLNSLRHYINTFSTV